MLRECLFLEHHLISVHHAAVDRKQTEPSCWNKRAGFRCEPVEWRIIKLFIIFHHHSSDPVWCFIVEARLTDELQSRFHTSNKFWVWVVLDAWIRESFRFQRLNEWWDEGTRDRSWCRMSQSEVSESKSAVPGKSGRSILVTGICCDYLLIRQLNLTASLGL